MTVITIAVVREGRIITSTFRDGKVVVDSHLEREDHYFERSAWTEREFLHSARSYASTPEKEPIITVCIMQDQDTVTLTYRDGSMLVNSHRLRGDEFSNEHQQFKNFRATEFLAMLPEFLRLTAPKVDPDGTIISGHARMRSR